jgi:intracellular multiplication protein IcmP
MAQGGGKGDDVELTFVMLCVLFGVVCWGIWSMAKGPIVEGIRWVKGAELSVIEMFDPSVGDDRRLLFKLKNDQDTIRQLKDQADKAKPKRTISNETWIQGGMLAPEILWTASNRAGEYVRYPVILVLLYGAFFYTFMSKKTKFRTPFDLEGLLRTQAKQWPVVSPLVDFDPANIARNPGDPVPDVLPLFAEALSPEEWVSFHRIPLVNKIPDRDAMRRAFQQQLGPRWTGIEGLSPAQRCLMAAFALKGAQKRKDGDLLLGRIAQCWNHKTDFSPPMELMGEVDRLLNDEKIGGAAVRIANQYAYRTTALLGVLKWARERGGVCAAASFVWLRGHDRMLWYPLNNLGRRTYHPEGAGAMAHYMAEKAAGKPLPVPRLETAVLTMVQYWGRDEAGPPVVPPREEAKRRG